MTHSNEPPQALMTLAQISAILLIVCVIGAYIFPWVVPFIWDMPEGTTAPYYGLLVAIEVTRSVAALDDARKKPDKRD